MKLMDKKSIGIIYAIKLNPEQDIYKSIASFMSKYTDTPIEYYTLDMINKLVISAIADLLGCMEHPASFWREYHHLKDYPWKMSDFYAMCSALSTVQVKNNKEYVNGFWEID